MPKIELKFLSTKHVWSKPGLLGVVHFKGEYLRSREVKGSCIGTPTHQITLPHDVTQSGTLITS